jgi:hypothetical protein
VRSVVKMGPLVYHSMSCICAHCLIMDNLAVNLVPPYRMYFQASFLYTKDES